MILIKLGGSVITDKDKPLSPRRKVIDGIAKSLRVDEPIITVHGGGSFGHYWSVKYDMHTKEKRYDSRGVATVKNSMVDLDRMVLDSMLKNRLNPYGLPPAAFMSGNRSVPKRVREIEDIAKAGMIPVTYGDALWYGQKKTYILSGDRIMTHLARILKPRLCIFAMNEDGLYTDMESKKLIHELHGQHHSVAENDADITGGMTRKIQEASAIARNKVDVFFVNGNKPKRIKKAISLGKFEGTLIRGRNV